MIMGYSPAALRTVLSMVDKKMPNAVDSGVLADKAGYHNSRKRLDSLVRWRGDYSTALRADNQGDPDAASANDISFPPADMRLVTRRMVNAFKREDPRVRSCREFIGTLDSEEVIIWNQYLSGSGTRSRKGLIVPKQTAQMRTHLWHGHWSWLRRDCTTWADIKGVYEVVVGIADGDERPAAARPAVDLSDVQRAFKRGLKADTTTGVGDNDIQQIQRAINDRLNWDLAINGRPGPKTRRGMAILQCRLARLDPKRAWDNANFHPDADGIPGQQSLKWLGFDVRP